METEIIKKQKEWVSKMVGLNYKNRPLYGQYTEGRIDDFKKPWVILDKDDVILTRQILRSEIVFDFDCDSWKKVAREAKKLKKHLDTNDIPYIMAHSGGKGIHFHVFIDRNTIYLTDKKILEQVQECKIDFARVVRKLIFDDIVEKANLKVSSPKDRNGLDTTKVYFSTELGRGSLIREFGCMRKTGKVKSVIHDIPDELPEIYEDKVEFPSEVKLLNVGRWAKKIENELNNLIKIEKIKSNEPELDIVCDAKELPCYRNLLKGADSGVRNLAVFSLGRLASLVGNPQENTLKDMEEFCKNSKYRYNEAVQSVKSAYRYQEKRKLCGTICMNFGSEICSKRDCPINKLTEVKQ